MNDARIRPGSALPDRGALALGRRLAAQIERRSGKARMREAGGAEVGGR